MGVYVVIILVLVFVVGRDVYASDPLAVYFAVTVAFFFLARYLSTTYVIDDTYLYARRVVGSRRVALSEVRKIEFMRLRDLAPTGFFGSWGYRGRMWSPFVGAFDAIYTDPSGLLVTAGDVPVFISPVRYEAFARELSRRVRSYSGALAIDAGAR
ncbi:MAG: PH domain-containing protein [Thermoplasmata archaeon]